MMLRIGLRKSNRCAFTLIELIVVMTLLVVVMAVTFPTLQRFFRGRGLESEGRRFLSLTRYGQSRAVSEGIPMALWINPKKHTYGLEAQPGYLDRDDKAVEYDLDEKLEMEVMQPAANAVLLTESQLSRNNVKNRNAAIPEIRFSPDGSMDILSPFGVCLRETKGRQNALWVNQRHNRRGYEVDSQPPQMQLQRR